MRTTTNTAGKARAPTHEINVVVCCAFGDLTDVRRMEPALAAANVHVHLVPGIDRDLEGIAVHLLAEDEPTVFAIVHSAAMPSEPLEALIALFAEQHGPRHRLCVVEFDRAQPDKFVRAVHETVTTMRSQAWRPSTASPNGHAIHGRTGPQRSLECSDETPLEDLECLLLDGMPPEPSHDNSETQPDLNDSIIEVHRAVAARRKKRITLVTIAGVSAAALAVFAVGWFAGSRETPEPSKASLSTASTIGPSSNAGVRRGQTVTKVTTTVGDIELLPPSEREMSFTTARIRCARKSSQRSKGWRLPSIEQLRALQQAEALPQGVFWSATQTNDDERLTLSQDGRETPRSAMAPAIARTLCIRNG